MHGNEQLVVPIRNKPLEISKLVCSAERGSSERVGAERGAQGATRGTADRGPMDSRRDLARPEREPVLPRPSFDLTAIGVDASSVGAKLEILEAALSPSAKKPFVMRDQARR